MRISTFAPDESWMAYSNADIGASPFPFSKLPPEIRNMIYNLSSQNIYGHKKSHKAVYAYDLLNGPNIAPRRRQQMAFNNTGMIKQPALFRSCSLARSEGLPLYYRECTHIFERESTGESDTIILDWLRAITERGFYVQKLHILTASSYNDRLSHPVSSGPICDPLRNLTKEIYSILSQDITLFHSDYYGTPFLNTILVDLATYIHTLRDWLFGNGADAPVFKFEQTIEYIDANPIKTLSYVQRWHRESDPVFLETPATLIASSQTAHYLAKRPSIFPHSILPSETP